jgi:hypothetical protein
VAFVSSSLSLTACPSFAHGFIPVIGVAAPLIDYIVLYLSAMSYANNDDKVLIVIDTVDYPVITLSYSVQTSGFHFFSAASES